MVFVPRLPAHVCGIRWTPSLRQLTLTHFVMDFILITLMSLSSSTRIPFRAGLAGSLLPSRLWPSAFSETPQQQQRILTVLNLRCFWPPILRSVILNRASLNYPSGMCTRIWRNMCLPASVRSSASVVRIFPRFAAFHRVLKYCVLPLICSWSHFFFPLNGKLLLCVCCWWF